MNNFNIQQDENDHEKSDNEQDQQQNNKMMANLSNYDNLNYFGLIQKDLISSPTGGLLLMSQGTGVYKVIGEYLDQFDKGAQTIFFLLNFDERDSLHTEINEIQNYCKNHKIVDVSSMISTKRSDIYNKGGVFAVSEIVLLFDLLSGNIIHAERITGFIINRVQTVRDPKENLVWLCTLLKTNNPSSIILGLSECEQTLASRGLENVMRWFYLPRCFVWNMIRAEVQNEERLEILKLFYKQVIQKDNQCEHLDTYVDMNKRMKNIDNCIKVIIILILKELKAKRNPHEQAEYPIFTEEEFMNSHQYILEDKIKSNKLYLRAFLNNVQYFKDAFDFKQLQKDLFQLNCVMFYKRLLSIDYNSTEDSFINKTAADKSTAKVIKELFENAQKRVYELSKTEENVEVKINQSHLNLQDRNSGIFEKRVNLLGNLNMMPAQNSNSELQALKFARGEDQLIDENEINQEGIRSKSLSNNNLDDKMSNSNKNSQETELEGMGSQFQIDKKEEKIQSTQHIIMGSVLESKKEDEEDRQEEEEQKVDKGQSLINAFRMLDEDEGNPDDFIKANTDLHQQIEMQRNIIEQDPNSIMEGIQKNGIKDYMFLDDDLDNEDTIKYEMKYKIKLNLDIDPKFKCLSVILNEINEKYKDSLPINGERFLIWIHTNDRQRVSAIQEYIQNAFLKNDPSNKLSLMKKYRLFLGSDQLSRRHSYLKDLIKKKKDILLEDKKECENVLLESLYKELDYLFQIIEFEQLDLNKEGNMHIYQPDNFSFDFLQDSRTRQSIDLKLKRKSSSSSQSDQQIQNDLKSVSQDKKAKRSVDKENSQSDQLVMEKDKNSINKIKNVDRMKLVENINELLEVKKRKLQIDDKLKKKFKIIDVNSMDLNIIDEVDATGYVQFLSKQIMPNFEFIVNSTNKSVVRQNFLRTYRPNFIILFEPNLNIIREVTVQQHLIKNNGVNPIYELRTIMFNKSAESEKTLYNSIQENQATERIVKEKNSISNSIDDPVLRIKNITKKANTRIGGQLLQLQPIVIIDKREFRSDLPTILFHEGFKIIPIQLNTGDYILSKDIAIERKSVETPDLVNSLRNGRLYQQLTAMSKAYKKCYLLIEFSETMPFSLDSINYNYENPLFQHDHSQNMNNNNKLPKTNTITFYLPLLVSQFENVKILWSKGPLHTSKLFQMLKQNQLEPNALEFLKEQDKKEKKESVIDQYVTSNQDEDKYKPTQKTLFESIKNNEEEN